MTDLAPLNPSTSLNKAYAGGGAVMVAGALTTVTVAIINGIDPSYHMTDVLQGSIQTLFTLACTFGAIYFTPHS